MLKVHCDFWIWRVMSRRILGNSPLASLWIWPPQCPPPILFFPSETPVRYILNLLFQFFLSLNLSFIFPISLSPCAAFWEVSSDRSLPSSYLPSPQHRGPFLGTLYGASWYERTLVQVCQSNPSLAGGGQEEGTTSWGVSSGMESNQKRREVTAGGRLGCGNT